VAFLTNLTATNASEVITLLHLRNMMMVIIKLLTAAAEVCFVAHDITNGQYWKRPIKHNACTRVCEKENWQNQLNNFCSRQCKTFSLRQTLLHYRRRWSSASTFIGHDHARRPIYEQVNCQWPCLPSAALRTWNCLPTSVRAATSLSTFRQKLKSFFFRSSYYGRCH